MAAERRARRARRRRFITTQVEVEGRDEVRVVEIPELDPAPWTKDADLAVVGRRVRRADAVEKVTGRACYTTDVRRSGMLHAAILRSPIAHGRLVALDLSPALRLPGVHAAISRGDIGSIELRESGLTLFDPVIRYAGQPLAALCAESRALAAAALKRIEAHFDVRPHALTAADALAPLAPQVRERGNRVPGTPRIRERGNIRQGLSQADVVVEREYTTSVALHSALEPHAAVAEWSGEHLTVWESTQGVFGVRSDLATALNLPLSRVRVLQEHMGGGFGAKTGASTNALIAALLARRVGRPVRSVNSREEEQTDSGNRPATIQRVTIGATRAGILTAISLDAQIPLGVAGWEGGPASIYHELYACPNVRTSETFVYTHAAAMSSFRAPGHVEGAFGLERAMDVLARELGIDPLELRIRNYARRDESKGRRYSSKRLDECYRRGAERFGWGARRNTGAPGCLRGFGVASQIWGGGGGPPAYALVRINPDGSIDVLTGTQDLGTGSRTVFAQIAAESLGARVEDVRVVLGDTERTPYTGNSWGSMTVASVGPAVRAAAEDARSQLLQAAAGMLGVAVSRLETRRGVVRARRSRRTLSFGEIGARLGDVMIIGRGSRGPNPRKATLATFGVQFAEVEVDVETGVVRVVRLTAVHDSGRIINPTLAESQLEGGIIQGMGYALFEERVIDRSLGVALNPTLHDYKIPTHADVPAIDAGFLDGADPLANNLGALGVAEPPIIPTAPAIANAVADALDVEIAQLPLTPWRVLDAIGARR
ncbi:MAG TPA: xanthine dehydrogenase family protein molybdopterin-binding subunit [Gemmatimonadaceae bacterium]|nr:xanthine dehydrogenase family protein molybdopterin-binding subunit [Gemmatimonadaceae bacterium]